MSVRLPCQTSAPAGIACLPVGGDGTSAACHHELDLEPLELIAVSMALAPGWLGADLSQGGCSTLSPREPI
jgi:hypothetical protein